jgi:uncharacterized protein YkwD
MRTLALVALVAVAGCASASPDTRGGAGPPERASAPPSAGSPTSPAAEADLARRIHDEANAARRRSGRAPLGLRDDLAAVARGHSRDMAARDFFSHRSPEGRGPEDRARAAGVACRVPSADGRRIREGVNENLFRTAIALHVTLVRRGADVRRLADDRPPGVLARAVIDGWLGSPGHRRTLLDRDARAHGLGVTIRPDSTLFVAQVVC